MISGCRRIFFARHCEEPATKQSIPALLTGIWIATPFGARNDFGVCPRCHVIFRHCEEPATKQSICGLLFQHKKEFVDVDVPVFQVAAAAEGVVLDFYGLYLAVFLQHAFHLVKTYEAFGIVRYDCIPCV